MPGGARVKPGETVDLFKVLDPETTAFEDVFIKSVEAPHGDVYREVVVKKSLQVVEFDLSSFHYAIVRQSNIDATNSASAGQVFSAAANDKFQWLWAVTAVEHPLMMAENNLSLPPATASQDGYLTKEDWQLFSGLRDQIVIWQYQDFNAPVGSSLTLTAFENGTGLAFNAGFIVDGTAEIVRQSDTGKAPTTTNSIPGRLLPANRVAVSSHIGTTIVLNQAPESSQNVRVFYQISVPQNVGLPTGYVEDPEFANDTSFDNLDELYVNVNSTESIYGTKTFETGWALTPGAQDGYIIEGDGSGNASWASFLSKSSIQNRAVVGKSGNVDYTSIKEALDFVAAQSPSDSNEWLILVHPGEYTEDPMTISAGIFLSDASNSRFPSVTIIASNSSENLLTMTGGSVSGFEFRGVTDPLKACVDINSPAQSSLIVHCSFKNCSTGIHVYNGAVAILDDIGVNITGVGQQITDSVIKASGSSTKVLGGSWLINVPSGVLAAYGSDDPIAAGIKVSQATCSVNAITCTLNSNTGNTSAVFAENGASCILFTGRFLECDTAVEIGASGSDTLVNLQTARFTDNTLNFDVKSSTGTVFAIGSADEQKSNVVTGGTIDGILQVIDQDVTELVGNVNVEFESGRNASLRKYMNEFSLSGRLSGGNVTDGGGLNADVSDGYGWVRRENGVNDLHRINWGSTSVSLTPSTTNFIVYNANTLQITSSTSTPNDFDIKLAEIETDGSGIRFIHDTTFSSLAPLKHIEDYLLDTRKFTIGTGLTGSTGSSETKFSVDSGNYYRGLTNITFDGYSDAVFSYFYNSGNSEISDQTDVDIQNYDNNGTLTAMTDGYYRADTIVLTSDGRVSLFYGTAEYFTAAAAEDAGVPVIPSFMEETAITPANLIIQDGYGIVDIIDKRPIASFVEAGAVGAGGGVSNHGSLSGLDDDDHPQYFLVSGSRGMGGDLDMNSNNIIDVGNIDGVDVSNHGSRHDPGGIDALSTGTPVAVLAGAGQSAGVAASYSLSDHQHSINTGTPSTIGSSNSEGVSSSIPRLDHIHAHGDQAGGSLHSVATTGTAGFLSAADKTKLDDIIDGYVDALPGTSGDPSSSNRYVTDQDPRNTNARTPTGSAGGQLGGTYPNPDVRGIRETSGPTELTIGDIPDGYNLQRSGSSVIGVEPIDSPTKEVFYLAEGNSNTGDFRTRSIGASGSWNFTFYIPHDFNSIIDLVAVAAATGGGAVGTGKDIDLSSDYGGIGEQGTVNSETDTASTYTIPAVGELFELDLTPVFSNLDPGDICGVNIDHNGIGGSVDYLGIRLRYS